MTYLCSNPTGYFQSRIIQSMAIHDECKRLAIYLQYPSLAEIHYQDVPCPVDLTAGDVEEFSDDYFKNSEEILRGFYRDGKLSDALVEEYELSFLSMQFSQDDDKYEFPEQPVRDYARLRRNLKPQLEHPPQIVAQKEIRTVHKVRLSDGKLWGIDTLNVRRQTMLLYTPEGGRGLCFCQKCRKIKPYGLIEVNNLLATPKFYFPQTRVALCLECSKQFEDIRFRNAKSKGNDPFLTAIRRAHIGANGFVDVPLDETSSIRFTATHLAEIQEILRSILP